MILSCLVASALIVKLDWRDAYDNGIGFLLINIIQPKGFAQFLLVILALSGKFMI
jgi:hypothetical protein